jgi:undecaprenyl diphosphate synthase
MWTRIVKQSSVWQDSVEEDLHHVLLEDDDSLFDNASHFFGSCQLQENCQQYTVWTLTAKVLQWAKVVVLKIAKSYHAFPVVLVLFPLLVGLWIGYALGRKQGQPVKPKQQSTSLQPRLLLLWTATVLLRQISSWMRLDFFRQKKKQNDDDWNPKKKSRVVQEELLPTTPTSSTPETISEREVRAKQELLDQSMQSESGIPLDRLPKHVAVIMDGNRRYGREMYGEESAGHWDGCRKLLEMCGWCQAEHISELTVYAFSTENWNRSPTEVATLMALFLQYCHQLRTQAVERKIRVTVVSTDTTRIPAAVRAGLEQLERETEQLADTTLQLNVCLSYGSRGEIVQAAQALARDAAAGRLQASDITETTFGECLSASSDPDLLIRTSGEVRMSNFLLWQLAYAELFFVDQRWPAFQKQDFLQILRVYASSRQRRFGK